MAGRSTGAPTATSAPAATAGDPATSASTSATATGAAASAGSSGSSLFLVVLAVGVLLVMTTVARPLVRSSSCRGPRATRAPCGSAFVAGPRPRGPRPALTAPAGADSTEVEFVVESGDTPATVAPRLAEAGLIASERAFLFEAREQDLAAKLTAGAFALAGNLTPGEVVDGLIDNRIVTHAVDVTFREGLRLEQMTAKLADDRRLAVRPRGVLRPRHEADGRAPGRLPVAARREHPAQGQPRSRASCTRRPTRSGSTPSGRRRPRTSSARCSTPSRTASARSGSTSPRSAASRSTRS